MYSYPNLIPLPVPEIHRIVQAVDPFGFDRIYGFQSDLVVASDAKTAVAHSAERYVHALSASTPRP